MYLDPNDPVLQSWRGGRSPHPQYVQPTTQPGRMVGYLMTPEFPETPLPSLQPWWTHPIVVIGGFLSALALVSDAFSDTQARTCGICGRAGHNRATCPHGGTRAHFSPAIPKSRRCECCGQYGRCIHRHHTRGRQDISDYLDVCSDCHIDCCHEGDYRSLAKKPQVCRVADQPSYWRL